MEFVCLFHCKQEGVQDVLEGLFEMCLRGSWLRNSYVITISQYYQHGFRSTDYFHSVAENRLSSVINGVSLENW
jgi:hypothetical protein